MKKTNAIRILDKNKIKYDQVSYTYDPNDLDVAKIAAENKMDVATIFKTLVAKGDKSGVIVALVPGDKQLDYKALAKATRNKKITLIPIKELLTTTGYIRGGCSPLGMKKKYPVYIDETAKKMSKIYINAGERGQLFGLAPDDLQKATRGSFLPIGIQIDE